MNNIEKEYIHGDKFYEISDFVFSDMIHDSYEVLCNKSGIIFCKTDFIYELFRKIKDSLNKYILITHNSDLCITEKEWCQKPDCVKIWFAQNVIYKDYNLIPIPIGMERPLLYTREGIRKGNNGDINIIKNAGRCIDMSDKKDVLMAFNPDNNPENRYNIINYFSNIPWVTYVKDRIDFKSYINMLRNYKYVLSPEGNGPDCHRTWEAIYLEGVIPIVKRSVFTEYFKELPILLIDDFLSIDINFLNESYIKICNKSKEKATMSYWFKTIKERANSIL